MPRQAWLVRWHRWLAVTGSLAAVAVFLHIHHKMDNRCMYDCGPREVHLSLVDPTSVRVTWRTNTPDCGSLVLYQKDRPGRPIRDNLFPRYIPRTFGESASYSSDDFCGAPANGTSFSINVYSAVLTDLTPGEEYVYMISGGCEEFRFKAPLGVGPNAGPFEFIAFGDMGVGPGQDVVLKALEKEVAQRQPRFVFLNGDVSYGNGDGQVWEQFMDNIQPVASRVPWMVSCGNHEYTLASGLDRDPWGVTPFRPEWAPTDYGLHNDAGGECGLQLAWRFPTLRTGLTATRSEVQPPASGAAFPPFWYSYEYGAALFVVLSSEHDLGEGSLQRRWFESELAHVDRCLTPFVVVFYHRATQSPAYWYTSYETDHLSPLIRDVFIQAKVDLIVSGHQHLYYRGCAFQPEYDHELQGSGLMENGEGCWGQGGGGVKEVVIGTGGHPLDKVTEDMAGSKYISQWGFGRFSVAADSLKFEFVGAENHQVLDSMSLDSQELCGDPAQ